MATGIESATDDLAPPERATARRQRMRTRTIGWLTIVWASIVAGVLIWQTVAYRGLMARLAEWQFATFDGFFPVGTIVALTALLSSPLLILLAFRLVRRGRSGPPDAGRMIARATLLRQAMIFAGAAFLAVAAALLVFGLVLARPTEKAVEIRLGTPAAAAPGEGAATLHGTLLRNRIGYYRQGMVLLGRDLRVAPMVASGSDGRVLQYFVQVGDRQPSEPEEASRTGILRRAAVPGGLRSLYRDAGYRVAEPTYMLFSSEASARWVYLNAAANLGIAGLLLLIFGLILARRVRKLRPALEA